MTGDVTSRQIVPKSPACPEGLFLMDGIEGLRSLPKHSVDMLLTDPPYGTTRNFWDVPLPLPELWEAVKWAVKPDGAVLFFAQCPYDKVLGASNLAMLRYEWVWYKSRCTGFLNARRAPLKRTENILVFYQKLPYYDPQFEQGKPYKKISRTGDNSPNYGKFLRSSSGSEDGLRFPGNLLSFSSVQRTVHPTQKPVELCEYLIKTYTRPGEVVADICAGSGTTAVAALNMGRRFVCFETAPAFYAPATERIRLATEAVKWAVKPDGAVLFFAQCPYDKVLGASNLSMLRYEWVWYKSRCTGFLNARRAPLKRTENILVFYQKLPYYDPQFEQGKPYKKISRTGDNSPNYGKFLRSSSGSEDGLRFPGNLLAFSSVQRTIHPTQKPVELCEYLIRTYTRPGELVADICAGSGTTAVAAVNTRRRFVCFETAPAFYAPATERIRLATEAVKAGQKGV